MRQTLSTDQADGGPADGPVTALDMAKSSDHLVSGYLSGRIILWDVMRGVALKAVAGLHEMPITCVRFVMEDSPRVMSVDARGNANLVTFTNRFMGWGFDSQCLLDGSAGQIVAVSVMPNFKLPPMAGEDESVPLAGLRHVAAMGPLVAVSTREFTFIVALLPEPRVMHRWKRPDDVGAGELPCLAWHRARVGAEARRHADGGALAVGVGFPAPVLARGWGQHLQLLQVQPEGGFVLEAAPGTGGAGGDDGHSGESGSAGGGSGRARGGTSGSASAVGAGSGVSGAIRSLRRRELSFVEVDDLECSVVVHGIAWLSEQVRNGGAAAGRVCVCVWGGGADAHAFAGARVLERRFRGRRV